LGYYRLVALADGKTVLASLASYIDTDTVVTEGVDRVIEDRSAVTPGLVCFMVRGRRSSYVELAAGSLPLAAAVVLGAPSDPSAACTEVQFPGLPGPACTHVASRGRILCK
jgi:hypothetical protein